MSIIVPVYNVEAYLPRCLDSILAQTLADWECICIDDGSPDGCGAILDEYAAKDTRFVVIHKENGGTSTARNAGLDVARAEYIGFVDPDDWIEPNTYELALDAAHRSDADIVQWGWIGEGKRGSFPQAEKKEGFFDIARNPEYYNVVVWNKLFRSRLVFENKLAFPPGVRLGEDRAFSFKGCVLAQKCFYLNMNAYHFFSRPDSSSHSQDEALILGEAKEIEKLEDFVARMASSDCAAADNKEEKRREEKRREEKRREEKSARLPSAFFFKKYY